MVNANFLKKLLMVGEKNVLFKMTGYIDYAQKAVEVLEKMLQIDRVDYDALNNEVRIIEREADILTMEIKHDITSGAISSNLMDNLANLVETCDDILDKSYYISREIRRMGKNHNRKDDDSTKMLKTGYSVFIKMLEISRKSLEDVRSIFLNAESAQLTSHRKNIEKLEEDVDELKDDLIDELYRNADSISFLVFSHVIGVVHKIDDLLDDCEDISDLIMNIETSVTK
ncbi:DUF47 family protein [Oxyplasma meridianum]|uniref:DUF47 family protein n=1 Tax=Oxyplasma meridianum TaxID=3073602 RepID=A0AAX4NIW9_9ARCH